MAASLSPDGVASWLGTMASAISAQVLSQLKATVASQRINGLAFSEILNDCRLDDLGVEHLSPLHMNRIRKAWTTDFPDSTNARRASHGVLPAGHDPSGMQPRTDIQGSKQAMNAWADPPPRRFESPMKGKQAFAQPVYDEGINTMQMRAPQHQMEMRGLQNQMGYHSGGPGPPVAHDRGRGVSVAHDRGLMSGSPQAVLAALVVLVVERLADWAGLDRKAALTELRTVLPPQVWEELAAVFLRTPPNAHMANVLHMRAADIVAQEVEKWSNSAADDYSGPLRSGGHGAAGFGRGMAGGMSGGMAREALARSPSPNPARGSYDQPRGGFEQQRDSFESRRGNFEPPRGGFEQPRGGFEPLGGGFEQPRGGFELPRGGRDPEQHRGDFDQPRGGFELPRGGFEPPRGGREQTRGSSFEPPRDSSFDPPGGNNFEPQRGGFQPPRGGFEAPKGSPATFEPPKAGLQAPRGGPASFEPQPRPRQNIGEVVAQREQSNLPGASPEAPLSSGSTQNRRVRGGGGASRHDAGRAGPPPARPSAPPTVSSDTSDGVRAPHAVASWVRALPNTLVPDKQRESLAVAVENEGLNGDTFTKVAANPSELASRGVPSPVHALKVRKAWDQVLREDACMQIARESHNSHSQTPKAVKMVF